MLLTTDYNAYLQSSEWNLRRKRALERAKRRCQVCNSRISLHVHHRTYERLGNERDDDLTVLCAKCHAIFHQHRRDALAQSAKAISDERKKRAEKNRKSIDKNREKLYLQKAGKTKQAKAAQRHAARRRKQEDILKDVVIVKKRSLTPAEPAL